jgi:DNA-binding MarR family transcriptional regulator
MNDHGVPMTEFVDTQQQVDWLSPEELAAWRGLMRMQAQLGAYLNRDLSAQSELSLQDYGVLVVLSETETGLLRPFELGRELGWEKSRLSHHLGRMEARGLVQRQRCQTDQRGQLVAITERGRQVLVGAAPAHVAQVRRAFVDLLTPEQLKAVTAISEAVLGALSNTCNESAPPDG